MLRNQNIARYNRYRYEIAAAVCLTVAAIGLWAAAALSSEGHQSDRDEARAHIPSPAN